MEVLSFIVSDRKIIEIFHCFLKSYRKLAYSIKDIDTEFYINSITNKNEIYFHYYFNDIQEEFNYNYSIEEQIEIKTYFENKDVGIFDIQYKDELFLIEMLNFFYQVLVKDYPLFIEKILLSHTKKGVCTFEKFIIKR